MTPSPHRAPRAFRSTLKAELPKWQAEGLVDESTSAKLSARYALEEDDLGLATTAVYVLGALLIGGGLISFVAWNWESLPDALKITLVVGIMLAIEIGGYRLWYVTGRRERLGHALLLLGTLVFGANIGLVAQIFNVHSHWYNGVGAWALATLAMAWVLRSSIVGALAAVLLTVWAGGFGADHEPLATALPYAILIALAPLAIFQRSAFFSAVTLLTTTVVVGIGAVHALPSEGVSIVIICLIAITVAAGLAQHGSRTGGDQWYGPTFRWLALLGISVLAYLTSFHEIAEELQLKRVLGGPPISLILAFGIPTAGAIAISIAGWIAPGRRSDGLALTMLFGAALLLGAAAIPNDGVLNAVLAHVVVAAVVGMCVQKSLSELTRGPFWLGLLLGGAVIISRFFEFETGLLLKAVIFTACGLAVIGVGIAFENRLKSRRHHVR